MGGKGCTERKPATPEEYPQSLEVITEQMSVQQYRGHANSQPLIMQLFQVNLFKQVTTDMFTDSKHPEIQREIADGNQDAGNQKKAVCQKNLT